MKAYELGLLANSDQIWYRKVEQQAYRYGGLKDEKNLTAEDIKYLKKNWLANILIIIYPCEWIEEKLYYFFQQ